MAQSRAGEGIDKWLASLGKPKRASEVTNPYREWSPENQRELDRKNAINDFIDMLTRHGEVNARPDLERSVEENNASHVGSAKPVAAPGVRGPMARYVPGVAGTGQVGDNVKHAQDPGSAALSKLLAFLDDHLTTRPTVRAQFNSDNPSPELIRQVDQNNSSRWLKQAGKPGKPLNRGLF